MPFLGVYSMETMELSKKKLFSLETLLKSCDIHASRLQAACESLSPLLPLKIDRIPSLTIGELGSMELMMSRFSKLQDTIGAKLFPLILQFVQQNEKSDSFLDMLHRLEKLEILHSATWWLKIRELRNHLVHDYPENPQLMIDNFNQAVISAHELLDYWIKLSVFTQKIKDQWLKEINEISH